MATMKHRMIQKRNVNVDRLRLLTDKTNFTVADKLALGDQLYRKTTDITSIKVLKDTGIISFAKAKEMEKDAVPAKKGDTFGESWTTHWFFIEFTVPSDWADAAAEEDEMHLIWDSGCEAAVYDYETGMYLQAFSVPRRNYYTLEAQPGSKLKFAIELAANGMFGNFCDGRGGMNPVDHHKSYKLEKCQIGLFRKNLWELKQDFDTIFDISEKMTDDNSGYADFALGVGNQMADILFTMDEISDEDIKKARKIAQKYLSVKNHDHVHQVFAVGHCHIDTAWLWPYRETRRKCARSWTTQLKLMKQYKNFVFCASSAQQYAFVKEDYPELFARIQDAAKAGRFEVVGGTWVEFDGNIPSGESMCRQFLYGQNFFKENFGSYCKNFFMPDTFGYSAQLPQIMNESEINWFVTQKLSWNRFNKFPHNTFLWHGLDGSEVKAHFPPADTYNSDGKLQDVLKSVNNFKDKAVTNVSLMLYGEGDGGGGPERQMIDSLHRFENLQGVPKVKISTVNEFFSALEKEDNELYIWKGELYLEIHNGTYTTMAHNKRCNRKLEFLLRDAEVINSILSTHSEAHPDSKQEFDKVWKQMLCDQFHDVIPGTSIGLVFEDTKKNYAYAFESITKILTESTLSLVQSLTGNQISNLTPVDKSCENKNLVMVNYENFERQEYVNFTIGGTKVSGLVKVPQAGVKICQSDSICSDGAQIMFEEDKESYTVENEFYKVIIQKTGRITSYVDKTICPKSSKGVEIVDSSQEAINMLRLHNDIPDFWDAWDIFDWARFTHQDILADPTKTEIYDDSKVALGLKFTYKISETSELTQIVYFYSHTQRIDFQNNCDWDENRKLLRTYFPVNVLSDYVSYDIQNGVLRRSSTNNTTWEQAQYEVCGHKFADLSETAFGVSILNDCKYGYSCKGNLIGLSLLRSPKWPHEKADIGPHSFTYSLFVHKGNNLTEVSQAAFSLNSPLRIYAFGGEKVGEWESSLVTLDEGNVVLDAFKLREGSRDEYVVRVHEALGKSTDVKVDLTFLEKIGKKVESVVEVNVLENVKEPQEGVILEQSEQGFMLRMKPFKIVTVLVKFI